MLAAELQLPFADTAVDAPEDAMYRCPSCPKLFVTKHGLAKHIETHHKAPRDSLLTPSMRQILTQAVMTDDLAMLLSNTSLLQKLNKECSKCGFQTTKRASLTTHFLQAHPDVWPAAEQLLLDLVPCSTFAT